MKHMKPIYAMKRIDFAVVWGLFSAEHVYILF